jgi:hypothetical protein
MHSGQNRQRVFLEILLVLQVLVERQECLKTIG